MENAATTLISNAGQLLGAEYRHLSGVGDEITELRDELDIMNALLRMQAEAEEGATDHFVRVAMKQLRELAYDAEDRIDLYLLHIKCRPGDGVRARFKHLLATLFARRRLAGEVSALRARAVAISERHARYGVNRDALRRSRAPMLMASAPAQVLRFANSDAGHRQFIGMEDQVENLANRHKAEVDGEKRLKVFSIVGFGGVGKTTLAVEVCRRLEQEFPFQAMVSVSQAFEPSRDLEPLLKRVLDQVVKVKAADERGIMEEGSLGNVDGLDSLQLAEELKKRLENKRLVDLEGCQGVTNKHARYACQLHLLKFLSLRGSKISVLPRQVGNLQHLSLIYAPPYLKAHQILSQSWRDLKSCLSAIGKNSWMVCGNYLEGLVR